MLQNLSKGKIVEWVVLLVALVALGLSIASVAKPCKSDFGDFLNDGGGNPGQQPECCDPTEPTSSCTAHGSDLQCSPDPRCSTRYSCLPVGHSPLKCTKNGKPLP